MSLAARIAVGPSRRLGVLAAVAAGAGVVVATSTVVARWPGAAPWAWIVAVVASGVLASAATRRNRRDPCRITVSDRPGIDVLRDGDESDGQTWRLVAPTVVWPAFCLVALVRDDHEVGRTRPMHVGIFDFELASEDRRSLRRFLTWSLRGGAASPRPMPTGAHR